MNLLCKIFVLYIFAYGIYPFLRRVARNSQLTSQEVEEVAKVLGSDAISYNDVKVVQGGIFSLIFLLNGKRAFTIFRNINVPTRGNGSREECDILVHELVHVYQFEKVGDRYICEALNAQRQGGYDYGSWQGLVQAHSNGKTYSEFNREQQGQIAQDYYVVAFDQNRADDDPVKMAYEPYIAQLKAGAL